MKLRPRHLTLAQARKRLGKTRQVLLQGRDALLERRQHILLHRQGRKTHRKIQRARGKQHWYRRGSLLPLLQHLLPLGFVLWTVGLRGQVIEEVCLEETRIDSLPLRSLRAELDATAFFHDNEYASLVQRGYTLPGARLNPRLSYNPLRQVNIEAGVSMLLYNGANKYPNYAYHDIEKWKGNQYQRGCHVLPWIRLQASFRHVDVILGNLYSAQNHRLSAPLFNPEQALSADPESGFQILTSRPHFTSDTWLSWESFIFDLDSHQEAFTVGEHMRLRWGESREGWAYHVPLQLMIQHRGGEQDTTHLGVQTLCNLALGLSLERQPALPSLDLFQAEALALFSYQQNGHIWPFDTGAALYLSTRLRLLRHLELAAGYFHAPRHFATVFGNPFFGTLSILDAATHYSGLHTAHLSAGYTYTFARDYTLGAQAELFCQRSPGRDSHASFCDTNFSFGVYFHVSPSILIKKF